MKKLKSGHRSVKLLNIKESNNPRCEIWKREPYSSTGTEGSVLDRKLANMTIGILVNLGIFITTGYFSAEAEREANRDGAPPIELVDCDKLIEMFEKTELGLKAITTYEVEHQFFEKYMES